MKEVLFATHNSGKLVEVNQILEPYDIHLTSLKDHGISDVEETGTTFIENALLKAHHGAQFIDMPILADDSGICVNALQGAPGIYSARYAGEHGNSESNKAKMLQELEGKTNRAAYFYTCMVLLRHKGDPAPLISEGFWHGEIGTEPKGNNGFGYDPLFWVPTHDKTAAELDDYEKNKLSARGQALQHMIKLIETRF